MRPQSRGRVRYKKWSILKRIRVFLNTGYTYKQLLRIKRTTEDGFVYAAPKVMRALREFEYDEPISNRTRVESRKKSKRTKNKRKENIPDFLYASPEVMYEKYRKSHRIRCFFEDLLRDDYDEDYYFDDLDEEYPRNHAVKNSRYSAPYYGETLVYAPAERMPHVLENNTQVNGPYEYVTNSRAIVYDAPDKETIEALKKYRR